MKESILYKILSLIHVFFFLSVLCFGIIFLSLTILMVPAVTSAFMIGKELIYKKYDITDSLIKKYFQYLKESFYLMKYAGINLVAILNIGGVYLGIRLEQTIYSVLCLAITAFLYTFILYLAGYYTFVNRKITLVEVFICMFYKPGLLIPVIVLMILLLFFFRMLLVKIFLIAGAFPMLVLEMVIFLHTLHYRKLMGELTEDDEYAYLVKRKKD
ncbi:MAG: hypothetical protein NC433_03330 [Clostridiales bacterium]|nr:hypothetical protein [Clostridiales bacterium]